MPRVVHFEICADDVDRAIKFYTEVFGWNVNQGGGPQSYWLITTGEEGQPGINGGLMKRTNPITTGVNIIDVPSVDEYTSKIVSGGGSVVIPKFPVKGIGYAAYFKDTEGSMFGVIEGDPSAE